MLQTYDNYFPLAYFACPLELFLYILPRTGIVVMSLIMKILYSLALLWMLGAAIWFTIGVVNFQPPEKPPVKTKDSGQTQLIRAPGNNVPDIFFRHTGWPREKSGGDIS